MRNKENAVSVIIPTQGNRSNLPKAISSVLNQKDVLCQIIVVFNGYKEDFDKIKEELLLKYKDLPVEIYEIKESGANKARNLGVAKSSYDIIAFLDDDDDWLSNKLKLQVTELIKTKSNFSYTARNIVTPIKTYYSFKEPKNKDYYNLIASENFIGGFSSVLLKKELFYLAGELDSNLSCFQDYEFYLRAMKYAKISYVKEPVVNYSQHFGVKISNNYIANKESSLIIKEKYLESERYLKIEKSLRTMLIRKGIKYFNFNVLFFALRNFR